MPGSSGMKDLPGGAAPGAHSLADMVMRLSRHG
jgi:hypothetical protein